MDDERARQGDESVASKRAREDVLRRLYALPWASRLLVWQQLGDDLEAGGATELRVSRQLRERAAAAACVRRAMTHAGLESGSTLTGVQYDAAAAALDLELSRQQVIRAWGTWRLARDAARGADVPATVEQQAQRRARGGRARTREDHLTALRLWLAEADAESQAGVDYDAWRTRRNERPDIEAQSPTSAAISKALCIPWKAATSVAVGSLTLDDARAAHLAASLRASGPYQLVNTQGVALVMGISWNDASRAARAEGFPVPAARLGSADTWYFDDVQHYIAAGRRTARKPYELQGEVLDSAQLASLTELRRDAVIAGIHRKEWRWVPQPAGRVGNQHYWQHGPVTVWIHDRNARRR